MADVYTASATLDEGLSFIGHTSTGHELVLDAADGGGRGPTPMALVVLALAGCTGMDVIAMLRKMRQEVTGYEVRVRGERAAEHPRIYTTVVVEHIVRGRNLDEANVARAVELSATRYCPVSAMLGASATVTHGHRIIEEDTIEASR
jgi:putative redox protein